MGALVLMAQAAYACGKVQPMWQGIYALKQNKLLFIGPFFFKRRP